LHNPYRLLLLYANAPEKKRFDIFRGNISPLNHYILWFIASNCLYIVVPYGRSQRAGKEVRVDKEVNNLSWLAPLDASPLSGASKGNTSA
jgi:hypothetical protein